MYSVWCQYIGSDTAGNSTSNTSGWIENNEGVITFKTMEEAETECEANKNYNWLRAYFLFEAREYK